MTPRICILTTMVNRIHSLDNAPQTSADNTREVKLRSYTGIDRLAALATKALQPLSLFLSLSLQHCRSLWRALIAGLSLQSRSKTGTRFHLSQTDFDFSQRFYGFHTNSRSHHAQLKCVLTLTLEPCYLAGTSKD